MPGESWKKAGGGFGPVRTRRGRLGRARRGERAILEIAKYQKDGGYLIPRAAFSRLAREVFEEVVGETDGEVPVTRIQRSAIEALQRITETHMARVLNGGFSLF